LDTDANQLLDRAWLAYSQGEPFMTDAEFDTLAEIYNYESFTEGTILKKATHKFQMYSLQKVFDEDPAPNSISGKTIETLKLDGAAISLYYSNGNLVKGITRGDGIEGEDITEKVYSIPTIPNIVPQLSAYQIDGEIVCSKEIENSRNFASGALHTKSINEFKTEKAKKLHFLAYRVSPFLTDDYEEDMMCLFNYGFDTVLHIPGLEPYWFPTDGKVIRINDNATYAKLGFTAKHPRGAYARKLSSDVEIKETELLEVKWQVGKSGKVTPVAIFSEIVIDDAKINRATLHNVGFIEDMGLEIGDIILVTRSGGIIPKVLGKL